MTAIHTLPHLALALSGRFELIYRRHPQARNATLSGSHRR